MHKQKGLEVIQGLFCFRDLALSGWAQGRRRLLSAKQPTFVQQFVADLRPPLQRLADGGGDGLAGFAAQAALFVDQDGDAAQRAHFIGPGGDGQADAELLLHAVLQAAQVGQAGDLLQALQQALFFFAGEQQHPGIGLGVLQQGVAVAYAGAGRAFGADGQRGGRRVHGAVIVPLALQLRMALRESSGAAGWVL